MSSAATLSYHTSTPMPDLQSASLSYSFAPYRPQPTEHILFSSSFDSLSGPDLTLSLQPLSSPRPSESSLDTGDVRQSSANRTNSIGDRPHDLSTQKRPPAVQRLSFGSSSPDPKRSGSFDSGRTEASSRTVSSISSENSTTSSASTVSSLVTPASSSSQLEPISVHDPSAPPDVTTQRDPKGQKKGSNGFGMLKGWFGGSTGSSKKGKGKGKPEKEEVVAPTKSLPVPGTSAPWADLLAKPNPAKIPLASRASLDLSPPSPAFMNQSYRGSSPLSSPTGSPTGSPLLKLSPLPPTTPLPSKPIRQNTGASQSLVSSAPMQPSLTPLQSLHLLSSQKLSLLLRPSSPHPFFTSKLANPSHKDGDNKRYPASTNTYPSMRGRRAQVTGLAAEVGIRCLMQNLESGGCVSVEEMDSLVRLFQARPVSLRRDKSGRLVASMLPASETSASAAEFVPIASMPRASLHTAGSGILAFASRPSIETRCIVYTADRAGKVTSGPILPARGLGVMELEFSVGMEAYVREINHKASPSFGMKRFVSGTGLSSLVPPVGRTSPTDPRPADIDKVVVDRLPRLLSVVVNPRRSIESSSTRPASNLASIRESQSLAPKFHPHRSPSTPSLPQAAPSSRVSPISPVTRQSFPPPHGTLLSGSAVGDQEEEDETPLAEIRRRHSTIVLSSNPTPSRERVRFAVESIKQKPTKVSWKEDDSLAEEVARRRKREDDEREAFERDRLRAEEDERRRQDRQRAEIAATRGRRDQAKLGVKKGNNGNYEDWEAASARITTSSRTSRSEELRPPVDSSASLEAQSSRRDRGMRTSESSTRLERSRSSYFDVSPSTSTSVSPQSTSPGSSSPRSSVISSLRPPTINKRHSTASNNPSPLSSSIDQLSRSNVHRAATTRPPARHSHSLSIQLPAAPPMQQPPIPHSYSSPSLPPVAFPTHHAYSSMGYSPPIAYYLPPSLAYHPGYPVHSYPQPNHHPQLAFPQKDFNFPHHEHQLPNHLQAFPVQLPLAARANRGNLNQLSGSSTSRRR